jgi:putative transposase
MSEHRIEALQLLEEAVAAGCRLGVACSELGLAVRTVQRWRKHPDGGEDCRRGPVAIPANKLSDEERDEVVRVANAPEHRNLSPKQIVPKLADQGIYIASESTFYRILEERGQLVPRGASKPRTVSRPDELLMTGPNQCWSWDITYLPGPVKGTFFYLYLFLDVWSRRIMKAVVHEAENAETASKLFAEACVEHGIAADQLVLHSDNGGPMKGATMLATLQSLGVVPSFSRPSVSNDNPFSEALFRTLKYIPSYPRKPFESADAAWAWVERFVAWYNHQHLHSGIGFVSPDARHRGVDIDLLEARRKVYRAARARNPERWSRNTRAWDATALVALNPRDPNTSARVQTVLRVGAPSPGSAPSSSTTTTPSRTEKSVAA